MCICENCNKEYSLNEGWSSRFCSKSCARSFSSKFAREHKIKNLICSNCGKEFQVRYNVSSNILCEECRKQRGKVQKALRAKNYYREMKNLNKIEEKDLSSCIFCGEKGGKHLDGCIELHSHHNIIFYQKLSRFTFDISKLGSSEAIIEKERVRNYLYDLYWNQKIIGRNFSEKFNYHRSITDIFKIFDIPIRTASERVRESLLQSNSQRKIQRHYQYHCENHLSWENKTFFLRSSFEIDYANYLDKNKISYEVEKIRIPYFDQRREEERIAIPDFYLPATNELVEIKSPYSLDPLELQSKFLKYHEEGYKVKLIFCGKETTIEKILEEYEEDFDEKSNKHYLKRKNTAKRSEKHIWINNGIIEKRIAIKYLPEMDNSYIKGRLKHK